MSMEEFDAEVERGKIFTAPALKDLAKARKDIKDQEAKLKEKGIVVLAAGSENLTSDYDVTYIIPKGAVGVQEVTVYYYFS